MSENTRLSSKDPSKPRQKSGLRCNLERVEACIPELES